MLVGASFSGVEVTRLDEVVLVWLVQKGLVCASAHALVRVCHVHCCGFSVLRKLVCALYNSRSPVLLVLLCVGRVVL